jgi:hypothetical protein
MNAEERQALREKHRPGGRNNDICDTCGWWSESGYEYLSIDYPCDVIKVLDAWEEREKQWIKGATLLADAGLAATGAFNALANQPCLKCGEKL